MLTDQNTWSIGLDTDLGDVANGSWYNRVIEGLVEKELQTAKGVFLTTYRDCRYWFRTPEAWTADGRFRACMYMRPLAIWAAEFALRSRDSKSKRYPPRYNKICRNMHNK